MTPYFEPEEKQKELEAVAKSWLGTPWSRRVFRKGIGTDCSRFLWQIWQECGVPTSPKTQINRYIVGPGVGSSADGVVDGILKENPHITQTEDSQVGDIVVLLGRGGYRHFCLLLPDDNIIHCDIPKGVQIRKKFEPKKLEIRNYRAWQS